MFLLFLLMCAVLIALWALTQLAFVGAAGFAALGAMTLQERRETQSNTLMQRLKRVAIETPISTIAFYLAASLAGFRIGAWALLRRLQTSASLSKVVSNIAFPERMLFQNAIGEIDNAVAFVVLLALESVLVATLLTLCVWLLRRMANFAIAQLPAVESNLRTRVVQWLAS